METSFQQADEEPTAGSSDRPHSYRRQSSIIYLANENEGINAS